VLQRDDRDLATLAEAELRPLIGARAGSIDRLVTRWGGSLPQYRVGHVERVARIRSVLSRTPELAVAGAAYDGVGIAACIASGHAAAAQIADAVRSR
jgi:oxygen-dependent protoporphyrinogen oxidase